MTNDPPRLNKADGKAPAAIAIFWASERSEISSRSTSPLMVVALKYRPYGRE
jgi:hypothetical protein